MGKKNKIQDPEKESLAQIHREIFNLIKEKQEENHHWGVDLGGEDYYALFRKKKNVMVLWNSFYEDEAKPFKDYFGKDKAMIILEKIKTGDYDDYQSLWSQRL